MAGNVHIRGVGGTSVGDTLPIGAPVRTWTNITPATLSSGDNTLVAAPSGANLNIIKNLGVQNIGTVVRTLILKNGSTAFRSWVIPAGGSVEINWGEGEEWRLTGAFVANASAGTDLVVSGGRYRVGAS